MRIRAKTNRVVRLPVRGGQDLRGLSPAERGETGRRQAPLLGEDRQEMALARRDFGGISDVLNALQSGSISNAEQLISSITIQSAYTPDVVVASPLAPSPPGAGDWIMTQVKPKVTVTFANNLLDPLVITPNGDPGPTRWPYVEAGLLLAGIGVVGLLVKAFRK